MAGRAVASTRKQKPLVRLWRPSRRVRTPRLEEVAGRSEEEVRAIKGVGGITMRALDKALMDYGLSFRRDREAV
jgi:hypothetical protein